MCCYWITQDCVYLTDVLTKTLVINRGIFFNSASLAALCLNSSFSLCYAE